MQIALLKLKLNEVIKPKPKMVLPDISAQISGNFYEKFDYVDDVFISVYCWLFVACYHTTN